MHIGLTGCYKVTSLETGVRYHHRTAVNADVDVSKVNHSGIDMHKQGANIDTREVVPLGVDT